MRFRPANIRLINRRSKLLRLLLALSSGKDKSNDNDKNNSQLCGVDTVTPYQTESLTEQAPLVLPQSAARRVFGLPNSGFATLKNPPDALQTPSGGLMRPTFPTLQRVRI